MFFLPAISDGSRLLEPLSARVFFRAAQGRGCALAQISPCQAASACRRGERDAAREAEGPLAPFEVRAVALLGVDPRRCSWPRLAAAKDGRRHR